MAEKGRFALFNCKGQAEAEATTSLLSQQLPQQANQLLFC